MDGQSLPGEPYQLDYKNNQYMTAYLSLFTGLGYYHSSFGNEISRDEFKAGYIEELLSGMDSFRGVFALDRIPAVEFYKPGLFVVNTDPISFPGQHWVAILIDDTSKFFDSLGREPSYYHEKIEHILINNSSTRKYKYNSMRIQRPESSTCGQFCIYYCLMRDANYTFQDIIYKFNKVNLSMNENIVLDMYKQISAVDEEYMNIITAINSIGKM